MTPEIKAEIVAHARQVYPRECCGLIIIERGRETYVPCNNMAPGPDQFDLDPADYARAEDRGEIVAVVHSHPNGSPAPSEADREACEMSGLPWHIVGFPVVSWASIEPCGYQVPLIGREWQHGTIDCYGIIRGYFRQVCGVTLPNFRRENNWWEAGKNIYLENFATAGFVNTGIDVNTDGDKLRQHDVVLMQIFSPVPNHGAVYAGDGIILHHLANRLSSRDVYGGYYRKHTTHVLRYAGNSKC